MEELKEYKEQQAAEALKKQEENPEKRDELEEPVLSLFSSL